MTHYKVTVGAGDSEQVTHFDVDHLNVNRAGEQTLIEAVAGDGAVVGEVSADAYQTVTWQEVDRV